MSTSTTSRPRRSGQHRSSSYLTAGDRAILSRIAKKAHIADSETDTYRFAISSEPYAQALSEAPPDPDIAAMSHDEVTTRYETLLRHLRDSHVIARNDPKTRIETDERGNHWLHISKTDMGGIKGYCGRAGFRIGGV